MGIRHLGFRGSGGGGKVSLLWSGSSLPSLSSVAAAPPTEGGAASVPSGPWRRLRLTQVRRREGLTSAEKSAEHPGQGGQAVGEGCGRRLARRSWGAGVGVWGLWPRLGVAEMPGWAASTLRATFGSGVVSALCPLTSRCRVAWFTESSLGCKHGTTLVLPRSGLHSWKVYIYRYNFVL